jgi:hypothetical protein
LTLLAAYVPKIEDLASVYSTGAHKQLNIQELAEIHAWVRRRFVEDTAGITVNYVDYQPYDRVAEMSRYVRMYRYLEVSSQFNNDPVLPGELNLMYRASHDMLHVALDAEFDWSGELAVARYALAGEIGRPLIQQLIVSETVLQAAHALVFGEFRDDQPFVAVGPQIIDMILDGSLS